MDIHVLRAPSGAHYCRTLTWARLPGPRRPTSAQPEASSLDHGEWLAILLEQEATLRRQKRFESRARAARLRHDAQVEDVDFRAERGLDRTLFLKRATCTSGHGLKIQAPAATPEKGPGAMGLPGHGMPDCEGAAWGLRHVRVCRLPCGPKRMGAPEDSAREPSKPHTVSGLWRMPAIFWTIVSISQMTLSWEHGPARACNTIIIPAIRTRWRPVRRFGPHASQ